MSHFETFGVMVDCSRNAVMTVKSLKNFIDLISKLGYNALMLYTEDTYEVENQPYFGYLRGRYTCAELMELDAYANKRGVELIPCIQTLAHLNAITRWPVYSDMIDCNDILLAGDERVYSLIDDMFRSLRKCFRSKRINIGMDEAIMIGLGKYLHQHGYQDRTDILLKHLNRVSEIAEKYDFAPMMWSDMFYRLANHGEYYCSSSEVNNLVPKNISLIYWDYYRTSKEHYDQMITSHQKFDNPVWFAGGAWKWTGFCPNNTFSLQANAASLASCIEHNVKNVFLTAWGDNGGECPVYAVLPTLFAASRIAKGTTDMKQIKKEFHDMFDISFDDFMLLDAANYVNGAGSCASNLCTYMLYNDCFLGIFDSTVSGIEPKKLADLSKKLDRLSNHKEFGYLFRSTSALCDLLSIKFDLGVRTRAAYDARDKKELKSILRDYKKLLKKIDIFYEAFKELWFKVNKPHGFDVQDIRLGGLSRRVKSCTERLNAYIKGEIEVIEELEETLLDVTGEKENFVKKPTECNIYSRFVTPNIL